MSGGRPTDYSLELAQEICEVISSTPKGYKVIVKENPHFPARPTLFRWLRKHKEFRDLYAQAKREQVEPLIDEIIEIADDIAHDTKINKQGEEVCNSEWINRSRLRIDTRKWIACKLLPRLYGDKVTVDADDTLKEKLGISTSRVKDADNQYTNDY